MNNADFVQTPQKQPNWHYTYVHNRQIGAFVAFVERNSSFKTFVLRTNNALDKRHAEDERAKKPNNAPVTQGLLIGGIVFIQGDKNDIGRFFKNYHLPYSLVHDCATHDCAVISDRVMRTLRQVADVAGDRLRFLPKPFAYYQAGHHLVRIVEGELKGLEGYIIRIFKDRKLVMGVGTLTLAIDGAHREIVEEAYPSTPPPAEEDTRQLTYLQEQIDGSLFLPASQEEVEMFADNVRILRDKALRLCTPQSEQTATDMLLFLLEEIVHYNVGLYVTGRFDLAPILRAAAEVKDAIDCLTEPDDPRLSQEEKFLLAQRFEAFSADKIYLFEKTQSNRPSRIGAAT